MLPGVTSKYFPHSCTECLLLCDKTVLTLKMHVIIFLLSSSFKREYKSKAHNDAANHGKYNKIFTTETKIKVKYFINQIFNHKTVDKSD